MIKYGRKTQMTITKQVNNNCLQRQQQQLLGDTVG